MILALSSLHIYFHNLDILVQNTLFKHNSIIAIVNMSIKDNIVISVSHIYVYSGELFKKIHYMVNVTLTEAKLFSIRCIIHQSYHIRVENRGLQLFYFCSYFSFFFLYFFYCSFTILSLKLRVRVSHVLHERA